MSLQKTLLAVLFSCAVVTAPLDAQHDHCGGALTIFKGVTVANNIGATLGPDPAPYCGIPGSDVWFTFTACCDGPWSASTCFAGTNFDTILTVWDGSGGCGALVPILCVDDSCGPPFSPFSSYVTFQSVAGTQYFFSVAGYFGAQGSFELTLEPIGTELEITTSGPGTIGYHVRGGPPGGVVFTAITLNNGFYPNGWFHGIDITFDELVGQITSGFPFVMLGDPVCGDVVMGPFGGLPPGITLYGVSVGIPVGSPYPHPRYTSPPAIGATY